MSIIKKAQQCARISSATSDLYRTSNLPSRVSFTVSGWVRRKASRIGNFQLLLCYDGTNWIEMGFDTVDDLYVQSNGQTKASFTNNFAVGEWFFCAIVGSPGFTADLTGYVANNSIFEKQVTGMTTGSAQSTLGLLNNPGNQWTDGNIADVGMWNVPLSEQQVRQVMREGPQSIKAGLIGHYPLDGHALDVAASAGKLDTVSNITWEAGPRLQRTESRFALADAPDARIIPIKTEWERQP